MDEFSSKNLLERIRLPEADRSQMARPDTNKATDRPSATEDIPSLF